jgi:hypothetical protein
VVELDKVLGTEAHNKLVFRRRSCGHKIKVLYHYRGVGDVACVAG